MSHIHLPDGLVPLWLWIPGWILALIWITVASRLIESRPEYRRKIPLVAVVAAFVLVAMSIEIAPLAYHVNLSILAGILLGPLLAPLAAFIVEIVLSLLGHGGITVLGINFILLSLEMVGGWALYRGISMITRSFITSDRTRLKTSVFLGTLIVLCCSTLLMLGVVYTAAPGLSALSSEHAADGHVDEGTASEQAEPPDEHSAEDEAHAHELPSDIRVFASTVLVLAPLGWLIEAILGAAIIGYIERVKPELLITQKRKQRS